MFRFLLILPIHIIDTHWYNTRKNVLKFTFYPKKSTSFYLQTNLQPNSVIQGGPTTPNPVQLARKISADIPPRRHSHPCRRHLSLSYLLRAVAARWLSGHLNEETCALATRLEGWYQRFADLRCAVFFFQTARRMSKSRKFSFFGERTPWVDVAQCLRVSCATYFSFTDRHTSTRLERRQLSLRIINCVLDRRTSVEHHKRRNTSILRAAHHFHYGLALTYLKVRTVTVSLRIDSKALCNAGNWAVTLGTT